MKASLQWLKDYVPLNLSAEALAHKLTLAGLEVEKLDDVSADKVFEMEITPNRPDCLNIIGIARELSAILNKTLSLPKTPKIKFPTEKAAVEIENKEDCSRYVGTIIKNVKVTPAPEDMRQRLQSVGLRPINNIVDITNFCLMETGQPLHAFDYDKLAGGKIIVRRAAKGEKIVTLDGVERQLDPSVLVIADAQKPVAIAGIMGGEATQVTERTKNILLESAYFDPVLIRRATRFLGLATDASYRFERGVDMPMVEGASNRATSLILECAGGDIAGHNDVFPGKKKQAHKAVTVRKQTIEFLLGAAVTLARCKTILAKLGFKVTIKAKDVICAVPPSFRSDVKRAEDIIEEIARIIGYDNLPQSLPRVVASQIPVNTKRLVKQEIRKILVGQGFNEMITYALVNQAMLDKTQLNQEKTLAVKNPLTQEQELMRPAVLPSMLSAVLLNFNRGQKILRLFETGKIYLPSGEEKEVLAMIMCGARTQDWRIMEKGTVDFYDLKGAVNEVLERLGIADARYLSTTKNILSRDEAATVYVEKKEIGLMGKVNPSITKNWDIKQSNVYFAHIDLEALDSHARKQRKYLPLPAYPAVTRDISLAVKQDVSFEAVQALIYQTGGELLAGVKFLEQYLGEKIPGGHRGIIFSLVYQSPSRTLTEEEVNKVHESLCQALVNKLGAVIR